MSSQAFCGTPDCMSLSPTLTKPLVSVTNFVIEGVSPLMGLLIGCESREGALVGILPTSATEGTMVGMAIEEQLKSISPLVVAPSALELLISGRRGETRMVGKVSNPVRMHPLLGSLGLLSS